MEAYKHVPIKIKLLKRKPGVVRDINSPQNQEIAKTLNELIDKMILVRPYHHMFSSMKAEVNNYRSLAKKIMAEKKIHKIGDFYEQHTDVGVVSLNGIESFSKKGAYMRKALENMNLELDFKRLRGDYKYKLDIDTVGMKLQSKFIAMYGELIEEFSAFQKTVSLEPCGDNELDNCIRFVATRLAFAREIKKKAMDYGELYRELKGIFQKASCSTGRFPRIYQYGGVRLGWQEVIEITNTSNLIFAYVDNLSIQEGEPYAHRFNKELSEINKNADDVKLKIEVKLDGVDYFETDEDDSGETSYEI